ncbi:hypothetical protein [Variovorax terrae]|uniref:Uncharacterized protein n=1 Tax=Variovorax terrae TaxID=2923278 RepID=A0A9X1VXF1_9BURK|nr:hypothetical protein [Variovorax terrae]MCJ0765601.1 hypothetical protein [Variovorax terrae]
MFSARSRCAALATLLAPAAFAQAPAIERVRLTDGELACSQIHAEIGSMDLAVLSTPQAATQALARKDFLTQLFVARGCRVSDLGFAGSPVPPETFRRLVAQAPAASVPPAMSATPAPASAADVQAALQAPVTVLDASRHIKGTAALKGKRYYVSEYRVMVETGGSITASTRAAYLGGTDYGATRMTVNYQAPQLDLAALQAVVDRSYADFVQRLEAAGAKPEPAEAIIKEAGGAVYEANLEASQPGAPVTDEADLGYGKRRYLVFAPTGMKLNPRGFAGLGAGNIGQRITYSKTHLEAISVVLAINLAAQESSGSGSSLFRRGSSASASAAMEAAGVPRMLLLQSHAQTQTLNVQGALPVPGQFATMRETGGYDTRQDAAVQGLQALGRIMGQAGNQSKRVDMTLDVDTAAMSRMALQGLVSMNQGIAGALQ